jgi:hypothetical protein
VLWGAGDCGLYSLAAVGNATEEAARPWFSLRSNIKKPEHFATELTCSIMKLNVTFNELK